MMLLVFQTSGFGESLSNLKETGFNWIKENLGDEFTEGETVISKLEDSIYLFVIDNKEQGKNSAYVVMKEQKDKQIIEIIEYGIGETVPYQTGIIINESLLHKEPDQSYYYSPLEGYWVFTSANSKLYVDSATGDLLPDLKQFEAGEDNFNYLNSKVKMSDYYFNQELIFNPYYNLEWLFADESEPSLTKVQIIKLLQDDQQVLYNGIKYEKTVHFAYPVIGYQAGDNLVYVALYDSNLYLIRYIEFDILKQFGNFEAHGSRNESSQRTL